LETTTIDSTSADAAKKATDIATAGLWETAKKARHVVVLVFVIIAFLSSAQSRSALGASIA